MDTLSYHLRCVRTPLAFNVAPGQSVTVGCSPRADVHLEHRCLSKLHFRLTNRDGRLLLESLRPRQNMVLNDTLFPNGGSRELSPGDRLGFVEYELVVEAVPTGAATEGPPP